VLGVAKVRPHDNFFDLGGDSLSAIAVRTLLKERLKVELPVHALLELRTVAALAEHIHESQPSSASAPPTYRSASVASGRGRGRLIVPLHVGSHRSPPWRRGTFTSCAPSSRRARTSWAATRPAA
jgi:acyl carrier protein